MRREYRNVSNAASHRPGSVLLMRDWNYPVLRDESKSRFQTDDVLNRGRPVIDPSVSVPTATEHKFAATPFAEPELDPHDV